jgi:hypothetical protein
MNYEPEKAYVYQPYPPTEEGKFYGVSGPDSLGFEDGGIKGISWKDANEIARECNENLDLAKDFIALMRHHLSLESKAFDCGCKFESLLSNAIVLCDKCEDEMELRR